MIQPAVPLVDELIPFIILKASQTSSLRLPLDPKRMDPFSVGAFRRQGVTAAIACG